MPYSPFEVKSIWSLAYSWDAHTSNTTALFDGTSDVQLHILEDYLKHKQRHLGHPLLLPIMILETMCQFSVYHKNVIQRSLYELEVNLGVTRGHPRNSELWTALPLESHINKCNRVATSLVYLERRLNFTGSLAREIDRQLNNSALLDSLPPPRQPQSLKLSMSNIVSNGITFVENQTNLCLCLQKRAQGLRDVVCYPGL